MMVYLLFLLSLLSLQSFAARVVQVDELRANTGAAALLATSTQLGYLSGVTANLQTQINGVSANSLPVAGGTMSGQLVIGVTSAQNLVLNRFGSDGALASIRRDGIEVGSISGTTTIVQFAAENNATYQVVTGGTARLSVTSSGGVTVANPGNWPFVRLTGDTMSGSLSGLNLGSGVSTWSQLNLKRNSSTGDGFIQWYLAGVSQLFIGSAITAPDGSGYDGLRLAQASTSSNVGVTTENTNILNATTKSILIETGNATSGNGGSGNIVLETGTADTGSGGVRGSLSLSADIIYASNKLELSGNLGLVSLGNRIEIKEGTDASVGTATLAAGTITVANTLVTANTNIFLTPQDNNCAGALRISARTANTDFTITSSNGADTCVVGWLFIERL